MAIALAGCGDAAGDGEAASPSSDAIATTTTTEATAEPIPISDNVTITPDVAAPGEPVLFTFEPPDRSRSEYVVIRPAFGDDELLYIIEAPSNLSGRGEITDVRALPEGAPITILGSGSSRPEGERIRLPLNIEGGDYAACLGPGLELCARLKVVHPTE